jgi:adenylate cyclase
VNLVFAISLKVVFVLPATGFVTAQLVDAVTGHHIWADRYDRRLEDVFAIQDEVTREIVTALRVKLTDGEQAQIWLRGTDSVEAWACTMSAFDLMLQATPGSMRDARRLLTRAIDIDPSYAEAYAMSGIVEWLERHYGFRNFDEQSVSRIGGFARTSLELNTSLGVGHFVAAAYALETGNHEEARRSGVRAVALSPNDALIRAFLARVLIDAGYANEAETHMRAAMRFNPFYPSFYNGVLANSLEQQGRSAEAMELLQAAVERDDDYFSGHVRLISLLGLAGRLKDARHHRMEAQRINPRFDSKSLASYYRSPNPEVTARFSEGLKRAGMLLD